MNYELEIAFDFKNSKEYFVRYEPIELTDSEKIPEKLKNKKLYVFEKVKPKAKNIGTFLLEFLNLDFSNALHLNYFLVHYFLVNFIASKKNYLNFEYYKSIDLTSEIMDNPKIILTEDEFIDYAEGTKLLYFSFIDSTQFVFRNIAEKIYFKTLFESSTEEDSDYESLKILKDNGIEVSADDVELAIENVGVFSDNNQQGVNEEISEENIDEFEFRRKQVDVRMVWKTLDGKYFIDVSSSNVIKRDIQSKEEKNMSS